MVKTQVDLILQQIISKEKKYILKTSVHEDKSKKSTEKNQNENTNIQFMAFLNESDCPDSIKIPISWYDEERFNFQISK